MSQMTVGSATVGRQRSALRRDGGIVGFSSCRLFGADVDEPGDSPGLAHDLVDGDGAGCEPWRPRCGLDVLAVDHGDLHVGPYCCGAEDGADPRALA